MSIVREQKQLEAFEALTKTLEKRGPSYQVEDVLGTNNTDRMRLLEYSGEWSKQIFKYSSDKILEFIFRPKQLPVYPNDMPIGG